MYINSIKLLGSSFGNNRANNKKCSPNNNIKLNNLAKRTLDDISFQSSNKLNTDRFTKNKNSSKNFHKPSIKNDASSFTDNDLDRLFFEHLYRI